MIIAIKGGEFDHSADHRGRRPRGRPRRLRRRLRRRRRQLQHIKSTCLSGRTFSITFTYGARPNQRTDPCSKQMEALV